MCLSKQFSGYQAFSSEQIKENLSSIDFGGAVSR